MLRPLILFVTVSSGGALGWWLGTPGGLMGSYLAGVVGSSIGLFIGRRIQRNLEGD